MKGFLVDSTFKENNFIDNNQTIVNYPNNFINYSNNFANNSYVLPVNLSHDKNITHSNSNIKSNIYNFVEYF